MIPPGTVFELQQPLPPKRWPVYQATLADLIEEFLRAARCAGRLSPREEKTP